MTETQVYQYILNGPELPRQQAIGYLYDKCLPVLQKQIDKNGPIQVEDIFQDGIFVMYQNLIKGKFRGDAKLSTYLISICKNLWLMELRKERKHEEIEMVADVSELIEDTIDYSKISQLLMELKESCQQILKSYYYEELEIGQIKDRFNLGSEQAVWTKKYRCLKALIKKVKDKGLSHESFTI